MPTSESEKRRWARRRREIVEIRSGRQEPILDHRNYGSDSSTRLQAEATMNIIDHSPENPMNETFYYTSETEINQLMLHTCMERLKVSVPGIKDAMRMSISRQLAAGFILALRKNATKTKGSV